MALRNLAVSSVLLATSAAGDNESDRRLFRFDEDSVFVKFDTLVTNVKKEVKKIIKENQCEVENAQKEVYQQNEKIFCNQYYRINNKSLRKCNPRQQPECELKSYNESNTQTLTRKLEQAAQDNDLKEFKKMLKKYSKMNERMGVYSDRTKESWKAEVAVHEQTMFDHAVQNGNLQMFGLLTNHVGKSYTEDEGAKRIKKLCFTARGESPSLLDEAIQNSFSDIVNSLTKMQVHLMMNLKLLKFQEPTLVEELLNQHRRAGTKLPIVQFKKLLDDYTATAERLSKASPTILELTQFADIQYLGWAMEMKHLNAFILLVKHVKRLNGENLVAYFTEKEYRNNSGLKISLEKHGKSLANNASLSSLEKKILKKINHFIANKLSSAIRV